MIWLMTPAQKPIPSPGYFQENPSLVRPKAQKRIEADTFLLTGQDFQLEFVNYCRWDNHWTTMEKTKSTYQQQKHLQTLFFGFAHVFQNNTSKLEKRRDPTSCITKAPPKGGFAKPEGFKPHLQFSKSMPVHVSSYFPYVTYPGPGFSNST